jgi:hypothetical protein
MMFSSFLLFCAAITRLIAAAANIECLDPRSGAGATRFKY